MAKETASHATLLKLSIASIIRRFEFDTEALTLLIGHLPEGPVRAGLAKFDKEIQAAIDNAKEIKP